MKVSKKATIIILAALLTTIVFPLTTQSADAADAKNTYAFIGAMPNPVGKGQTLILHVGIPDALQKDGDSWKGITVTVTRPDNTTETLNAPDTDSTGSTGVLYTPTMAGTYYFQTHFPAQWYNYSGYNFYLGMVVTSSTYYEASDSEKLAVEVLEEAIPYYPGLPLPTEYWTRPINAQLREWYQIGGNWLTPTPVLPIDNLYAPDNQGPESPHILWARPLGDMMGGLAGGVDQTGYGTGDAYEGKMNGQIIIGGVFYYNKYDSNQPQQEVTAIDLHTGEEQWTKSLNGRLAFGQVVRASTMNYQGDFSYIFTTSGGGYSGLPESWHAYDALTGDWKFNMTNVPSGVPSSFAGSTNYYGPHGEILRYNIAQNRLTQWNSTAAVISGNAGMTSAWGSQVSGESINAQAKGFDVNVTVPTGLTGSVRLANPLDRIVGADVTQQQVTIWALSLAPGQEGTLLYKKTWNAPTEWLSGNLTISWAAASLTDNVAVVWARETQQYYGFSLTTGNFLWGPSERQHYLSIFDLVTTINYGCVISTGCSGVTYCYNATTGERLWSLTAEDPYTEFTIGNDWWMQQQFIADGKVYIGQVEHSGNQPLPRGAPFLCIDIATGDIVWKMDGGFRSTCWGGKAIIGDSIIALQDTYDQRIYAIGKGPSRTTVNAAPKVTQNGGSIVIEGTISDISPGTEDYALRARFPDGVPVVSDESMGQWMKYVYMQFERPINVTGVPVTLYVLDANENYREIGSATTDANGFYSLSWTPDIDGKYTVYAIFAGSDSFYPSHSVTAFNVDPESPTASPQPTQSPSMADLYFLPAVVAIIVTIVLVGVFLAFFLKKQQ